MGNCLVLQLQEKVMKTDGEILKHKSPIKRVDQFLSNFTHATCDEHLLVKHMHPNNAQVLLQNHLHFPIKTTKKEKKTVRFSDREKASRVVRIKLVISKKELQQMLSEGEISVDGLILKLQNQEITSKVESNDGNEVTAKGWFPALQSIPEIY